jgi:uroporphyrinogen decarboxylase
MIAENPANDLLLRAAMRERTERTPVWLMRQAGRFDPAYRKLREEVGLPLEELFRRPDLAAEITILPQRFGVDALIIFQDILTPLAPIGAPFVFRPGPVLDRPIRSAADVDRLCTVDPADALPFVPESIRLVQNSIDGALPLLGFAGAPFTLAAFMVEGRSPGGELQQTRTLMQSDPALMHRLLDHLARYTASYLRMQIDAGVDAVQLFESVADLLTEEEYEAFAHPYQAAVLRELRDSVPRILFVKERDCLDLAIQTGAEVISIGGMDFAQAVSRVGDRVALQGNVDNRLLVEGPVERIEAAVRDCIIAGGHRGHILNLNHGLLMDTPVEHVCRLIETCKSVHVDAEHSGDEGAER